MDQESSPPPPLKKVKPRFVNKRVHVESKKDTPRRRREMSGGVSLRDMQEVALDLGESLDLGADIGNVINMNDMGDSLGLSMLANPTKTVTVGGGGGGGGSYSSNMGISDIEINTADEEVPITLNLGGGGGGGGMSAPIDIELKHAEADRGNSNTLYGNFQSASGPSISLQPSSTRANMEEEKKEKSEYLNKLQRLEQKGFPVSRRYTMDNSLDEMKTEYMRLVDARNLEASLRFQRQALVGVVTGLEWLNGRFDPFDLKLEGWSESIHENVEDFDEVFEELYDKYKDRGKMPPEMRLITSLAGSGFMCHVSNTFLKSRMPSADDILKQNPDLARQFAAAAANSAGPGFGNFMGMAMGVPQQGGAQPQQSPGPTGAFFGSSAAAGVEPSRQQQRAPMRGPQQVASRDEDAFPEKQTARREMRGPTGVDDILRTFEEARARELNEIPQSSSPSAAAAAVELQSMHSDDMGSAVESTRTGRTGGGRRRRQAVGNSISLNV
jgi:hypothetical protein